MTVAGPDRRDGCRTARTGRTPRELYEAPASRWIAEFIGDLNVFDGQIEAREHHRSRS